MSDRTSQPASARDCRLVHLLYIPCHPFALGFLILLCASQPANDCLATVGFGIYHSGVRIGGSEYTFSNDGVFSHQPGELGDDTPQREVVSFGDLSIDSRAVVSRRVKILFPNGS